MICHHQAHAAKAKQRVVPVAAFVTFEEEEGFARALRVRQG